ncbi:glycoside hydrolase family 16 protein [Coprinopsis marcescibilis]|uniref:Glycoside hydrolase family 16 protein n=1 Tax=Coprinopsis marcescibilis TaxID=230819 RepID=A0A5C3KKC2_COPMA|nr:glycoside hydrolase family 16 protein [Coprinopsis marcescibilis]
MGQFSSGDPPIASPLRASSFGILRQDSWQTLDALDSPYPRANSRLSYLSDKFSLSPDPRSWGSDLNPDLIENDDALHNPDTENDKNDAKHLLLNKRGILNVGCLVAMCMSLLFLFIGYPVIMYATHERRKSSGYNLGGINSTGQIPSIGNFGLIDLDTPEEAYIKRSYKDGKLLQLVFSDEFNTDGRTFYSGDDPYWEASDLHYWATNNMEWYDPAAVTTANGSLVITFREKETHGLHYEGGLLSSWNKFCFTGGYFEAAVQLPGASNVAGMWPAIWTMGNLGRAGYGATLEGMWPYTYDTCDVGTAPNQTLNGLPYAATVEGDWAYDYALSYLPGQKLSRCTCDGEDHPGPKHPDGTYVGRSSPEIDMFEAQMGGEPLMGQVSQSAQFAPFNRSYKWNSSTDNMIITNAARSEKNGFVGNVVQEAASVVTYTDQRCYEYVEDCYSIFGFEYKPGFDDSYITWISDERVAWTLNAAGVGADEAVEISARPIPQEPMYMILNLGMSKNFGDVDFDHLIFPQHLRVDYVRVYQPADAINVGCNPEGFPTVDYIERYMDAYTNPNLTTWRADYGQPFPKNSFIESCDGD